MNRVAIPLAPSVGLSAATTGTAALGAAGVLSASFAGFPTCLFAAATGVPCPFCGLTHGVAELGAGHVATAVGLHPLAPLAALLALAVPVALARNRALSMPAPLASRRAPADPAPPAGHRRAPATRDAHAPRHALTLPPAALAALAAVVVLTWIARVAA